MKEISLSKKLIVLVIVCLLAYAGYVAERRRELKAEIERETIRLSAERTRAVNEEFVLGTGEKKNVYLFFSNNKMANDPNSEDCSRVFPVSRMVEKVPGIAERTLNELFLGPTDLEKSLGYSSSIISGVRTEQVLLRDGALTISLDKSPIKGGSCALGGAISEIEHTARQFPGVNEVKILVGGNSDWINP